jgi:hypothetical protein
MLKTSEKQKVSTEIEDLQNKQEEI